MFSIFSRQIHGPEIQRRKEGRKKQFFHLRKEKYGTELLMSKTEATKLPTSKKKIVFTPRPESDWVALVASILTIVLFIGVWGLFLYGIYNFPIY